MSAPTILLFVLLWYIILYLSVNAFLTVCRTVRYRDAMVDLDAGRIATQSFQPAISLAVRCDLDRSTGQIAKIQRLMALNYARFEVIVISDSDEDPETFARLLDHFQMRGAPLPDKLRGLHYPVRAVYRSELLLYRRLVFVDKPFFSDDDLRHTGAAVGTADFMVFVPSIDDSLLPDSLACLAIMEMRDPKRRVTSVRAAARYDCTGPLHRNFFRIMADLCNLRRIYMGGAGKGVDFGLFITLTDTTGRKGSDEYVPRPLMILHRADSIATYLSQLAPRMPFHSFRGRMIAGAELAIALVFWGAAVHAVLRPQQLSGEGYGVACIFMLPLLSSVFAIFIGEVLLRKDHDIRLILSLLLVSVIESAAFFLLKPPLWIISLLRHRE
jgi:hypothetical protein